MKIKIFDGCMDFSLHIVPDDEKERVHWDDLRRSALHKMIDRIKNDNDLTNLVREVSYYIKPTIFETQDCDTCGNNTEYSEYEL